MKGSCPASFTRTRADLRNFPGRMIATRKTSCSLRATGTATKRHWSAFYWPATTR